MMSAEMQYLGGCGAKANPASGASSSSSDDAVGDGERLGE